MINRIESYFDDCREDTAQSLTIEEYAKLEVEHFLVLWLKNFTRHTVRPGVEEIIVHDKPKVMRYAVRLGGLTEREVKAIGPIVSRLGEYEFERKMTEWELCIMEGMRPQERADIASAMVAYDSAVEYIKENPPDTNRLEREVEAAEDHLRLLQDMDHVVKAAEKISVHRRPTPPTIIMQPIAPTSPPVDAGKGKGKRSSSEELEGKINEAVRIYLGNPEMSRAAIERAAQLNPKTLSRGKGKEMFDRAIQSNIPKRDENGRISD